MDNRSELRSPRFQRAILALHRGLWSLGRHHRKLLIGLLVLGCAVAILVLTPSTVSAQPSPFTPQIGLEQINNWFNFKGKTNDIETAPLRLDGRRLFLITAPSISEDVLSPLSPVNQRVGEIEERLEKFVDRPFDPETLQVTYQIENGLPVIFANDQELLTVTTRDAAIYGVDVETRAEDVAVQLSAALIRAQRERQPAFIKRQILVAIAVLLGVLALSGFTRYLQRYLQTRRQRLAAQARADLAASLATEDLHQFPEIAVTSALKQTHKHTRQQLNALQQEFLQLWQGLLWLAGALIILGLFPQTRWLQNGLLQIVRLPLQLAVIGFGTYFLVRLSTVFIDRFFKPLEKGDFLDRETAQKLLEPEVVERLALRVSTLSQVLKNVVAIGLSIAGILVGLTVLGIPLGPLIAGAGILGLAISFASQSVLKDSINGFLIFLEDQYGVGDWITVGDLSGLVEKIGLRITQLRDIEGALITIPNGDIRAVKNLSKNWARVDINVPIAYTANLMKAMQLMDAIAQEMYTDPQWREMILEPPVLMGADNFGDQGVIVKLWIKTRPLEQWKIAREYRRRLKLAFDHANIPLPLPQQVLWVRSPAPADSIPP